MGQWDYTGLIIPQQRVKATYPTNQGLSLRISGLWSGASGVRGFRAFRVLRFEVQIWEIVYIFLG